MTLPSTPDLYKLVRADGRVVYHLGSLGPLPANTDPNKAFHLGAYDENGYSVPNHWWNAEWTDRTNCPIVVRKSPAQIVSQHRMFPYGNMGAKVGTVANYTFKGPMDSAGITIYMPSTGERADIGLITDPSALYMLTGNPGPMIAWAQAAGSCPMHFRDEATGKPIDLLKYPVANQYSTPQQGSPWLCKGPKMANGYTEYGGGWTPQQAHYCEMSYLAYCATQDAGFLEDLQYSANFTVLADAYVSGGRKIATVSGELRGVAWAFRNLFMAHAATLDAEAAGTLPASCHGSAYWKQILDNQLAYYTTTYKNDPKNDAFRLVSGGNRFGPWQVDYMLLSLAFGVLTGHSDWAPLYLWALKNAIDRTSGKSGYPPGWGGAYYLNTCPWVLKADGTYDQGKFDTSKPFTWYDSFLFQQNDPNSARPSQAQIDALAIDPLNGWKSLVGAEYLMNTRAVLVCAAYLEQIGLVNVRAVYPDLDLCIANVDRMVRNNGAVNPRASIVLDASQAPATIPPLPIPTPTPVPQPVPEPKSEPVPVPPPAAYPNTVHGLLLRAQDILKLVK